MRFRSNDRSKTFKLYLKWHREGPLHIVNTDELIIIVLLMEDFTLNRQWQLIKEVSFNN